MIYERSTTTGTSLSCLLNMLILGLKGSFQEVVGRVIGLNKFVAFKHLNMPKGFVPNGNVSLDAG